MIPFLIFYGGMSALSAQWMLRQTPPMRGKEWFGFALLTVFWPLLAAFAIYMAVNDRGY